MYCVAKKYMNPITCMNFENWAIFSGRVNDLCKAINQTITWPFNYFSFARKGIFHIDRHSALPFFIYPGSDRKYPVPNKNIRFRPKISGYDQKYPVTTKNIRFRPKISGSNQKYPVPTKNIRLRPKISGSDQKYLAPNRIQPKYPALIKLTGHEQNIRPNYSNLTKISTPNKIFGPKMNIWIQPQYQVTTKMPGSATHCVEESLQFVMSGGNRALWFQTSDS